MLQSKLPFFINYFFICLESAGKELVHSTRNWSKSLLNVTRGASLGVSVGQESCAGDLWFVHVLIWK